MNTVFTNTVWMSPLFWTLTLLAIAVLLFVRNKIRMDVVALLVMTAFYLSGILTTNEIFAGFSDPNVILIALLFIVGEGLVRTGLAYQVSENILKLAGDSETESVNFTHVGRGGFGRLYEFDRHGGDFYSCCAHDLSPHESFAEAFDDAPVRSGSDQRYDDINCNGAESDGECGIDKRHWYAFALQLRLKCVGH